MTVDTTLTGGDRLHTLLPAALRRADAETGGAVRALLDLMAEQIAVVDADIEQLGENWFIETCAPWAIPYIGDLLGVRGVHQVTGAVATTGRAWVANTLRFRCRKGTRAMLEQLARDTTGWPAKAVEFFELLSTTQHVNHPRPRRPASADLRRADALELVGGPFDSFAHTADIRAIAGEQGWFNIPHVGLFLWPIGSYWMERVTPRPADPDDGRYRVDPLGVDRPLFVRPAGESGIEHVAQEENVPGLLRRRPLYVELEERRTALSTGRAPAGRFFGADPVFRVYAAKEATDTLEAVPEERLHVCDLSTWRRPAEAGHVLVDPVLGRVSFRDRPHRVRVSHAYGAGGDLGAGSYSRRDSLEAVLDRPVDWQAGVRAPEPGDPPEPGILHPDLATAVAAWNAWQDTHPGTFGVITVMDNHRYTDPLADGAGIRVGAGGKLAVVAAQWPSTPVAGGPPGKEERRPGRIEPVGLRPCVAGPLEVTGTAAAGTGPGELLIDGLLLDGELRVKASASGGLGRLVIRDSSLVPSAGGLRVEAGNPELTVEVHRSITGPISLPGMVRQLRVSDAVVQAAGDRALDAPGTDVTIDRSTVLGETVARKLFASDTLFTADVQIERGQAGCVRFSYVPQGSHTPRRYRCQPDTATQAAPPPLDEVVSSRLVPRFLSTEFGHFGYAYPAPDSPDELLTGAEHGVEIGAFGAVQRPQRLANLTRALDEYLPFGLEAAPLIVTPRSQQ
ncbi:hypothetical protein [Streptomyces triculaminicus]|uniref:hypothetical protein n=1 Tax=Streptomyces triculaminicus TaxID=2816232 RepID=UPI0037952FCC